MVKIIFKKKKLNAHLVIEIPSYIILKSENVLCFIYENWNFVNYFKFFHFGN